MSQSLVQTFNMGAVLAGNQVLADVSISLCKNEIITVVGPNGSGKTTLLRLIIGAEKPTTGTIQRANDLRIGYVPQRLSIDHTMPITVDRFLALADKNTSNHPKALERVGITGLGNRQMSGLSGGQFQRALLAQALLRRPNLLVLDEAAQGLDQPGEARFYRLIEELRRELECCVLMVSHDLHVVMSASDRVICLNGHVCCEGTPTVVSATPEYQALFGFGTEGALALYRHDHDHSHSHSGDGSHDHGHEHAEPGS